MKHLKTTCIILCLIIILSVSNNLIQIKAVSIFSDGEIGSTMETASDLSAWTGTAVEGTGTVSVSATQQHHGANSIKVTGASDSDCAYVQKSGLGDTSEYASVRFYIYVDKFSVADGSYTQIIQSYLSGGWQWFRLDLKDSTRKLRLTSNTDADGWNTVVTSATTLNEDQWYCVEIYFRSHATLGFYKVYLNGVEVGDLTLTGLDTDSMGGVDEIRLGNKGPRSYGANEFTAYYDCIILDTTYIGVESTTVFLNNIMTVLNADINKIMNVSLANVNTVMSQVNRTSTPTANAASGSPADIQAAINSLGAGGGIVNIPSGNFTFNPPLNGVGVTIPFSTSIEIIGAGIYQTRLQESNDSGTSFMFRRAWSGETTSGGHLRISGISFDGYTVADSQTNAGIKISCTQDFRVDNCSFTDFPNMGISISDDTGGTYDLISSGVIDHCAFDNPYHDAFLPKNVTAATWAVWGYGVVVVGDGSTWDPTISNYLGHYNQYTTFGGVVIPHSPIYIENCNFTRCRHAISSNSNGYYVARYCIFESPAPYGQIDVHGNAGLGWGGRGLEVYNCTIDLSDQSYSSGQSSAIEMRGGGGVVYNNTITLHDTLNSYKALELENDGEAPPYDVQDFYFWGNTIKYANGTVVTDYVDDNHGYTQDVNYFLRAPTIIDDGFTYTSYQYPHELVP